MQHPTRGGLLAQMRARQEYEGDKGEIPEDPEDTFGDDSGALGMQLKRRRFGGIYKKLLTDAGYGDLAKMVSVRRAGDNNGT